jgi:HlyD family secretion protein
VQREAESTRIDMAARVPGHLAKISVVRGQDVAAGATLLLIDNPELVAEQSDRRRAERSASGLALPVAAGPDLFHTCCDGGTTSGF